MTESDSTTKPPEKPATGIPTEFFRAMMRLEAQDNPAWKTISELRAAIAKARGQVWRE